ncbi:MAG TPA: hypothetical protein VEK36_00275 [Candidatus Paceibacterota bacterium]|nr:hypothetical protein [Candidatus Paceibacterota bacterium]
MKLNSLWAVLLILFIGIYPSEKFEWYAHVHNLDKVMHFLGGFVIAWSIWQLFEWERRQFSGFTIFILVVGGTAIIGIVWEIAEYFSNIYLGPSSSPVKQLIYHYFHGGDLTDTLGDLFSDLIGAVAFAVGSIVTRRRTVKR